MTAQIVVLGAQEAVTGDVRVPAAATLLAALVAVLGSVFVVWLNGRQQRRLQAAESADRTETGRRQQVHPDP